MDEEEERKEGLREAETKSDAMASKDDERRRRTATLASPIFFPFIYLYT